MKINEWNIDSLTGAYRKRSLSPVEVAKYCLSAIEKRGKDLNCFLQVREDAVLASAEDLEKKFNDKAKLPLYGVPIAIKDNFLVDGWQATAASKILQGYVSPYTATSVERLEAAGALIIGKTNLDEFAMGSSNENSAYGPVKNPWDTSRVPGGSSGGSAAAVAAHLCWGALGTDTGGSIRQPASLCGVVGLKPTYGRVSRYGVIAFASSLDQVGPFGRSVNDVARMMEAMAGYDRKDATSSRSVVPVYTESVARASAKNARFGVAKELLEGLDPEVRQSFDLLVQTMVANGAKVVDVSLPHSRYALSTYYLIAPSEASSNLARYDGIHYGYRSKGSRGELEQVYLKSRGEGFGPEVKLRIMLGTYALSAGYYDAYYGKANQVRQLISQDFVQAFEKCDCVLMPTSPSVAFKFGEKAADPLKMYASDVCTLPINLAGLPSVSVPSGLSSDKLPIGVQFVGRHFEEQRILDLAAAYEKLRGPFPIAPGVRE